ncbi:hypothetical protein FHR22_000814 [Sphingopyxis panaciterrae]|uniref:hypothetical protein n=1 Tax=Sphingopyxis panaciterrae TaxID=363841 RepID=UPI001423D70D|nr:hypothetical protein [Sphingopyxis panaciterrae]NIJ36165.1 hypothetical protein [Sphingopyxis panaciterrae]
MSMMFLAALLAAAQPVPEIRIEVVPGRGYAAKVARIDPDQYDPVIKRIQAIASERCGRQSVRFGRFYFDNMIDPSRGVTILEKFHQGFSCFDPATDPYKPVAADWKASAAETAAVNRFVTRFFDNLDAGNAKILVSMMDPMLETTEAEMKTFSDEAKRYQMGDGEFSPKLEDWLNNPPDAAYPGAYAFFSVIDNHPGIAGTCGGVLVQRVRDGEYRMSQYDVRYLSQTLVDDEGMSDAELERLCQR